jgi:hypothetical protein
MQKEYQQAPRHHKNRSLPAHTPQPRTAIPQLLPPSDACLLKRDEKKQGERNDKKKNHFPGKERGEVGDVEMWKYGTT